MQQKMRKILSLLLTLSMLLTMLPTTAVAAMFEEEDYAATVYVNGSSGNNSNSGTTDEDPVKTMTVAYEKLYALMDAAGKKTDPDSVGRIVVTGDVSFSTTNGPTPTTPPIPAARTTCSPFWSPARPPMLE